MKHPQHNSIRRLGPRAAALAAGVLAVVIGFGSSAMAGPDTVSDTPRNTTTFKGEVFSVAYAGNTIYVGGNFTGAIWNGHTTARTRLAAIDAVTGALLPWNPTADNTVRAIAVDGTNVYVGGNFALINGVARDHLAEIDGSTGALNTSFAHSVNSEVRALVTGNGLLYGAGLFTTVDGQSRPYLAAFGLSTGALSTTWAPATDDRADSLVFANSRVYVGGRFKQINGVNNPRLRSLDQSTGAVISGFKPTAPYEVYSLAVGANGVYGALGGPGGRAMAFSLSGSALWTITTDGDAQAIATMDQTVYVGGHFDNVCATSATGTNGVCLDGQVHRGKMFATDLSGTLLSWNPNGNGIQGTHQITVSTALHMVAVVGQFPQLNGVNHQGFAEFS